MTQRSTLASFASVCLFLLCAGALLYDNWSRLASFAPTIPVSLRWPALFTLVIFSQVLLAYVLWRITYRNQHTMVQTEVMNSMVHEFQTPISTIRMSIDILDSPIARNHSERTDKYIRIIREETERLQHQVETMLTLARADRNTLVLNTERIHVHHLLSALAERHGDYLHLDLADGDQYLVADRLHLTNILHNLLDNAIKYSADTPDVTIRTAVDNESFIISIRDQGVGIASDRINHIFQPFYRINDRNSPSVKGFGLGLSYVQRIVQAHGWTIWVKSALGKGSEFSIMIPVESVIRTCFSESPQEAA